MLLALLVVLLLLLLLPLILMTAGLWRPPAGDGAGAGRMGTIGRRSRRAPVGGAKRALPQPRGYLSGRRLLLFLQPPRRGRRGRRGLLLACSGERVIDVPAADAATLFPAEAAAVSRLGSAPAGGGGRRGRETATLETLGSVRRRQHRQGGGVAGAPRGDEGNRGRRRPRRPREPSAHRGDRGRVATLRTPSFLLEVRVLKRKRAGAKGEGE